MARLKASNPEIWKRDSLALLAEERCPVCVRLAREIPRHFFWFVNEHYYEVETITRFVNPMDSVPLTPWIFFKHGPARS